MMNFEGFVFDTSVCVVELKGELPIQFYEAMAPECFSVLIGQVDGIFVDRFGKEMSINEKQFVELLFWQNVGKPFVAFFSLLEQWMYWIGIDNDVLWEQVRVLEGENDES